MKIVSVALRIFVGFVFLFSAWIKLYPIELLEVAIVETGLVSWTIAPFAARALVGFEFFLGVMLITGLYKRFFISVSLGTLGIFSVYLLFLFITEGNNSNCNCFGLAWAMTPMQSIIKNLILAAVLLLVLFRSKQQTTKSRFRLYATIIAGVVSVALTFIFSPIIIGVNRFGDDPLNYPLELSLIYEDPSAAQPTVQLEKGKQIVVFLSSSCSHCIVAGYKFQVLKSDNPDMPVYFFINGDEEDIRDFHFKSKSSNIPYSPIKAKALIALAGTHLPAIFWLEDGVVVNKQTYFEISEEEINNWLLK